MQTDNKHKALKTLQELCEKSGFLPENFIIESGNFNDLDIFKQAGFYTSYYVPYYSKQDLDTKQEQIYKQLQEIANSGNVNALSFDYTYYKFVKDAKIKIIKNNELVDIDLLTWNMQKNYKEVSKIDAFFDPQIKVILAVEKGKYR